VANGHDDFADAMRKKLSLEVAGVSLGRRFAASNARPYFARAMAPDVASAAISASP